MKRNKLVKCFAPIQRYRIPHWRYISFWFVNQASLNAIGPITLGKKRFHGDDKIFSLRLRERHLQYFLIS